MASGKRKCLGVSSLLLVAARHALGQSTFTNPISPSGADPFVTLYNGVYYYTDTTGNNVSVAQSTTLPGIGSAAMTSVYTPTGGMGNVWAPELQRMNGTWFIYFAMGPSSNTNNQRTYVLKDTTSSPMGPYTFAGQINDPTNDWAIDPTVLNYNNSSYLIWSGWAGTTNVAQNLYIAPMTSPTTLGDRVLISSPTNSWEQQGGPPSVNEGPVVLTSAGGQTSILFSASGSWTNNYCLGQLELTGSNPLIAGNWTKDNAGPVFASANNVFGPGHSSYTTSDNGTRNWIVYHAAISSGSGWDRNIRTQPFSWNPDGTPSFGEPVPITCPIQWGPTSWVGAINESNNDTVHDYLNPANWVNGIVTDSFADVTLTDNTTLYFSADHATAGDINFTYGSGQMYLSFQSNNATNRTWTLNGNMNVSTLGGANNIYISTPARPVTLAMGSSQRNFNLSNSNTVWIQGGLTGSSGLSINGGGELILQGAKSYTGPTLISQGILSAGDGTAASSTANLPPATVVTINSSGTLLLPGLPAGGANETIAGLIGNGLVSAPTYPVTLTLSPISADTFSGQLTGSALSVTVAGPSSETLSGGSTWSGATIITGGSLKLTGSESGTSNLFVRKGSATIPAGGSLTTTGFVSVGQASTDVGTVNISGTVTVPSDLNIGDVSATGTMNIAAGAVIGCDTLYVGKYTTSNGTVNQTGGSIGARAGGADWRIGGAGSSADAAAVGIYNISGGSLSTGSYNFQIGAYGTGTLVQSAGTVTSGGYISVGRFAGGIGSYNISGGTLTGTSQPLLIVGEQGIGNLYVSGSAVVNANSLSIGHNGGSGEVNQSGGTVIATNIILGMNTGGGGTYMLSGGALDTTSISKGSGNGTFYFNGGDVIATASNTTFMQGLTTAAIQPGGAIFNTGGFNITINQPLVHGSSVAGTDGGLTKLGSGMLTLAGLETYTGNTNVSSGTLSLSPNTAGTILIRPLGSIAIAPGATLVAGATSANPGIGKTLLIAQDPISVSGTLNLGTNDLDVKNGNLTTLAQLVGNGYNGIGGPWSGNGITSSTAAADTTHLTALGIIQNNISGSALYSTFDTEPVTTADVLIKYTYYGDTDLDGKIDGTDYSRLDAGYLANATGWFNGDFNYDGAVNGSDYTLTDNAYNLQGAQILQQVAVPTSSIASVPEPTSVGIFCISAMGLLGRRKRMPRRCQ